MNLPYFKPIDVVPTTLFGYVQGDVRLENRTGDIAFDVVRHFFANQKPRHGFAITHLQKESRFGFLINWPFCFHVWVAFKKQEGNDVAGWVPGSEIVLYGRTPGYRQDTDYGVKWTWGYCGLHFD